MTNILQQDNRKVKQEIVMSDIWQNNGKAAYKANWGTVTRLRGKTIRCYIEDNWIKLTWYWQIYCIGNYRDIVQLYYWFYCIIGSIVLLVLLYCWFYCTISSIVLLSNIRILELLNLPHLSVWLLSLMVHHLFLKSLPKLTLKVFKQNFS